MAAKNLTFGEPNVYSRIASSKSAGILIRVNNPEAASAALSASTGAEYHTIYVARTRLHTICQASAPCRNGSENGLFSANVTNIIATLVQMKNRLGCTVNRKCPWRPII
jgi:hypothetical protein